MSDQVEALMEEEVEEVARTARDAVKSRTGSEIRDIVVKSVTLKRERVAPPVYELPMYEVSGVVNRAIAEGAQPEKRNFVVQIHTESARIISLRLY